MRGEPIHGILHSTNASGGVAIPIYADGSLTARTIAADEILHITAYEIYAVATGDAHLFIGVDGTIGTGETVARGTVATNTRLAGTRDPAVSMGKGLTAWLIAANGVVDVTFTGYITK